jgi:hypothetical protein
VLNNLGKGHGRTAIPPLVSGSRSGAAAIAGMSWCLAPGHGRPGQRKPKASPDARADDAAVRRRTAARPTTSRPRGMRS